MNPYTNLGELKSYAEITRMIVEMQATIWTELKHNGCSDRWWMLNTRLPIMRELQRRAKRYEDMDKDNPFA
jgi:hypothetical protein